MILWLFKEEYNNNSALEKKKCVKVLSSLDGLLSYFMFQPMLHNWCSKVYGMVDEKRIAQKGIINSMLYNIIKRKSLTWSHFSICSFSHY